MIEVQSRQWLRGIHSSCALLQLGQPDTQPPWRANMDQTFRPGDRAKVIAETGDDRFPMGTIVRVVRTPGGFGSGPPLVEIYREGKANIVESALPMTALTKLGS